MKVKNILKKNQIIIFALALMIAVAGYLNFSRDKLKEKDAEQAASSSVGDEIFANIEGESYTDISDEDDELLSNLGDVTGEQDVLVVNDPISTENSVTKSPEATKEPTQEKNSENAKTTQSENASPGEAILANTTINESYFSTAKLAREQNRAKNKENLMAIITDNTVSEGQKEEALDMMVELTAISEKENSIEILLEAKGYSGVVVSIVDDSVDVIVNAPSLTEQDMAIIEDVVLRKTEAEAANIAITNVVTEE